MSAAIKLWKRQYIKIAVAIGLIVGIVLGVWGGLRLGLNTEYPVLNVESGSMCVPFGTACDGWSHPFDQTLHIGDTLIVEGINPEEYNINYPDSDIIVYRDPLSNRLIVHRIVYAQDINGTLYFKTKGDANGPILWPNNPYYFDDIPDGRGVPENLIVGKVVMRIPWIGWIPLFLQKNVYAMPLVAALLVFAAVVLFLLPTLRKKRRAKQVSDMLKQL